MVFYGPLRNAVRRRLVHVRLPIAQRRPRVIVGIETSCDDTCVAIVRERGAIDESGIDAFEQPPGVIVDSQVASQARYHEETWGGVRPGCAARMHAEALPPLLNNASRIIAESPDLAETGVTHVAVTIGPGLDPCLWKGLNAAREAVGTGGLFEGAQLLPVHHLEAHLLSARAGAWTHLNRPFLTLLASGGHCLTATVFGPGVAPIVHGETRDDSLGEALDKTARLLGIEGGGAGIERVASGHGSDDGHPGESASREAGRADVEVFEMPVPMRGNPSRRRSPDFSFSGLKSHAARRASIAFPNCDLDAGKGGSARGALPTPHSFDPAGTSALAAAFQDAAFSHITDKLSVAMDAHEATISLEGGSTVDPRHRMNDKSDADHDRGPLKVVLCGGVAANMKLRERVEVLCERRGSDGGVRWELHCPEPSMCTDNAAMVAWAALERLIAREQGAGSPNVNVGGDETGVDINEWRPKPRWPLSAMMHVDRVS